MDIDSDMAVSRSWGSFKGFGAPFAKKNGLIQGRTGADPSGECCSRANYTKSHILSYGLSKDVIGKPKRGLLVGVR